MFVVSPHSSSMSWIPESVPFGGCASSSGKQRMASYKRKREGADAVEATEVDGMGSTGMSSSEDEGLEEQSKRARREGVEGDRDVPSRGMVLPPARPPTIDEQRQWTSQSGSECSQQQAEEPKSCSLWMNIQGDVDMRLDDLASSCTPVHDFFSTQNCFQLAISTPTGHPHPYSTSAYSPSRAQLGAGYFDLI